MFWIYQEKKGCLQTWCGYVATYPKFQHSEKQSFLMEQNIVKNNLRMFFFIFYY